MAKNKSTAPRLSVEVTADRWDRAVQSDSGGCLIADAIKDQYPHLSSVRVDMSTIRASDLAKGERYTWLTPSDAQNILLWFDQGWGYPPEQQIRLRNAAKVTRVYGSATGRAARAERKAALEAKADTGEALSRRESQSLSKMRATDERRPDPIPTSPGPVIGVDSHRLGPATVVGGRPLPTARKHPNLLANQNRHFGAKLSKPGVAFQEAVDKAVEERLAAATGGATKPAPAASTEV